MAKTKKGFLDGYKTYNPVIEGYGSPDSWTESFYQRMGVDRAKEVVGDNDPLAILGLSGKPTWDEIRKAYKKMILIWHPDRHCNSQESHDMTVKINAAVEVLEERFKK